MSYIKKFLDKRAAIKQEQKDRRKQMIVERGPAKQIIVVRKDLNMRKGKIAAQVAHASLGAVLKRSKTEYGFNDLGPTGKTKKVIEYYEGTAFEAWLDGTFTKICVSVNSEAELLEIEQKAKEAGLLNCLIQDSGKTEFHGVPTFTTLAIGPAWDSQLKIITGHLPLM